MSNLLATSILVLLTTTSIEVAEADEFIVRPWVSSKINAE